MAGIDIRQYQKQLSRQRASRTHHNGGSGSALDFLNKDFQLFGSGLNAKKKERFYSELSILFTSGVDIKTSLEMIAGEQKKGKDSILFTQIRDMVLKGEGLSKAIENTGKFSPYEYYSVQIGEETGRLTEVLEELANYFSRAIKQKRQITSALSYPAIVMIVAFGAVFFMLKFVVPMFAGVFQRFHGELPYLTRAIIHLSDAISNYAGLFFLIVIGLVVFISSQKKKPWFRKASSAFILKVPIIGELVQKIYLTRLCHSMNLLLTSKTPLVRAIDLVQKMIGFYPMEKALEAVSKDIISGKSFHQSLAVFPVFNKRMISLINVAEEVNQLDVIFGKLAKQYNDEVEHRSSLLGSIIEPVMIVFLGLMVALILVAMYLPMFKLSTTVG